MKKTYTFFNISINVLWSNTLMMNLKEFKQYTYFLFVFIYLLQCSDENQHYSVRYNATTNIRRITQVIIVKTHKYQHYKPI